VEFKQCTKGLHYLDLTEGNSAEVFCVKVVLTVQCNFEGYTKHKVLQAINTKRLQSMLGSPARADYEAMVHEKMTKDCPVNISELKNAHTIFGPDLTGLRGRAVRWKQEQIEIKIVFNSLRFLTAHKFIVMSADIMFVNRLSFLLTEVFSSSPLNIFRDKPQR